jgi:hypothetical protein
VPAVCPFSLVMPFLPAEVPDAGGQGDCRRRRATQAQRQPRRSRTHLRGPGAGRVPAPDRRVPGPSRLALRIRPATRSNSGDPVPDRGTRMPMFTPKRADAADRPILLFATGCDCAGELSFFVGRERRGRLARHPAVRNPIAADRLSCRNSTPVPVSRGHVFTTDPGASRGKSRAPLTLRRRRYATPVRPTATTGLDPRALVASFRPC